MLQQENRLTSELESIEIRGKIIKEEIELHLNEGASLDREEERYWRAYAEYQRDLIRTEDEKNR